MKYIYIGSKETTVTCRKEGIWIAVDRNGKEFINCEAGTRGTETEGKL